MQLNTRKPLLYVEDHNQITVCSKNVPGPIYSQVQTADLRTDLSQNPQRIELEQKSFACVLLRLDRWDEAYGFLSSLNQTNIDTCTCL